MIASIIGLACLLAYLLGSVPTAVWVGKALYHKDVRDFGSGNAGATNTIRVLGLRPGLAVLFIDVLKGLVATRLPLLLQAGTQDYGETLPWMLACGLASVIGHVFPLFAGFRGGKGVATLLGVAVALHPGVAGMAVLVFAITFALSGYVSLGSMLAAISFPLWQLLPLFAPIQPFLLGFGIAMAAVVVYTHRANITRLRQGTENRLFHKQKNRG